MNDVNNRVESVSSADWKRQYTIYVDLPDTDSETLGIEGEGIRLISAYNGEQKQQWHYRQL